VLYTSDANQISLPIAVLVNKNSASAAELLACAIKDYGKGTLVGTTTYGKGTMQQVFPLTDGSAVNLTIAKFYPPVSDNFDGVGVTPDISADLSEELQKKFYFLTDAEDTQLSTAVSALLIGGAQTNTSGTESAVAPGTDVASDAASAESSAAALADEARQDLQL